MLCLSSRKSRRIRGISRGPAPRRARRSILSARWGLRSTTASSNARDSTTGIRLKFILRFACGFHAAARGRRALVFHDKGEPRLYRDGDRRAGHLSCVRQGTKGLPEELTAAHFDRSVRIPMLSDKRSLNLSNSAAIAVYEVLRQNRFEGMKTDGEILAARAGIQ